MGALILLLSLTFGAAFAGEGEDVRARELFQNGAILYDEGRYEEAVLAFEEAYRLSGRPALLFNIANALERLGRWQEALDVLSRYRAYATAEERETLDRRIVNLERRIAEAAASPSPPPPPPTPVVLEPRVVDTAPPSEPTLFRPAPIVLASAGLLSVGVGAALGAGSLAAGETASSGCASDAAGHLLCGSSAAASLAEESGSALAADVLVGVGVASLGAGVALALWGEGGPLLVGPGFLAVQGSF